MGPVAPSLDNHIACSTLFCKLGKFVRCGDDLYLTVAKGEQPVDDSLTETRL